MIRSLRKALRRAYFSLHQSVFFLIGGKVKCNICGFVANRFADDSWHRYSICPRCGSSVRQRLLWQMLSVHPVLNHTNLIDGKHVLHFAPEAVLRDRIKKSAGEYVTADFFAEGYDYPEIDLNLDISDMTVIPTGSVDCIIACDVLEHVPDDKKALREILRILSPGGYCLLTVPQRDGAISTESDLSPMSPEEREKRFGQFDHFRIYGSDFIDTMNDAGFSVDVVDEIAFPRDAVERHVLFPPVISVHPLATNYRKVFVGKKGE